MNISKNMQNHKVYCSKCRENYSHRIAKYKSDTEIYRLINVIEIMASGHYKCQCQICNHQWKSKSTGAKKLYEKILLK